MSKEEITSQINRLGEELNEVQANFQAEFREALDAFQKEWEVKLSHVGHGFDLEVEVYTPMLSNFVLRDYL